MFYQEEIYGRLSTHDLTRRSTSSACAITLYTSSFQLTTSQGGRPTTRFSYIIRKSFNSRPHKEVDENLEGMEDE